MVKEAISFLLALAVLLAAGGCYWTRYPALMETHLTLMEEYAAKLQDLADEDRPVAPQDWGEFVYPHERAVEFARIVGGRFEGRPSLVAFSEVLERYNELVANPDLLRGAGASEAVARRRRSLNEAIAMTRSSLAREAS